jgi:hypothetical protein
MNNEILESEQQFFVEGVKTYFDVDDAMTEFRRLVQHKCTAVASKRLAEINQACGLSRKDKDLSDYLERFDQYHYLGKKVDVRGFGGIYFCLRFSRAIEGGPLSAYVYLYRSQRDRANSLWEGSNVDARVTHKSNHTLGFGRTLSEDDILNFENHLDQAITDFLAFIRDRGGLQKYLSS